MQGNIMHQSPTLFSAVAAGLLAVIWVSPAAAQGLSCRSQFSYSCAAGCVAEPGPADITFDPAGLMAEFCRGQSCDSGKLTLSTTTGQWDDATYQLFQVEGLKPAFKLSGVIFPGAKTFSAHSDELGEIAGTCEPSSP